MLAGCLMVLALVIGFALDYRDAKRNQRGRDGDTTPTWRRM